MSLNDGALKAIERDPLDVRPDARQFVLPNFLGQYVVQIRYVAEAATHTHPAEEERRPSHGECAEVIADLFRHLVAPRGGVVEGGGSPQPLSPEAGRRSQGGSGKVARMVPMPLAGDGGGLRPMTTAALEDGLDVAGAWGEYREQLAETSAIRLPVWEEVDLEVQEAFAAGLWHVVDGLFPLARYAMVGHRLVECRKCGKNLVAHRLKHGQTGLGYWLFPDVCVCGASATFAGGGL